MTEPTRPAAATAVETGDDWRAAWDDMVAAVGTDFSDGKTTYGPDTIERGTLRRYLEPLEFGCPLHHDAEVARAFGYPDVIVPYTAALSWSIPAMWSPGDPALFDDHRRDAQPARSPINDQGERPGPRTTGFFATDIELDFVRPLVLGERVGRRGNRLMSCTPKETAVGRGAFLTWESELVDAHGEVVARMRTGTYAYVPRPAESTAPVGAQEDR